MASRLGCHLLQGYLFARPMKAADLRALLEADACSLDTAAEGAGAAGPELEVVAA